MRIPDESIRDNWYYELLKKMQNNPEAEKKKALEEMLKEKETDAQTIMEAVREDDTGRTDIKGQIPAGENLDLQI